MSGTSAPRRARLFGALVVIAAVSLLIGVFVLKSREKGGKKDAPKDAVSQTAEGNRAQRTAKSRPLPGATLEMLLSVNESQSESVLFTDSECLLRVRVRNIRAYLERIQNPGKTAGVPPLVLGSAERSWDRGVRLFIVSAEASPDDVGRSLQARMIPAPEGEGPRISLDGKEEGNRSYLVSPEAWASLAAGDYYLFADFEPEGEVGKARSNFVAVKLSVFPENPAPEDLDARAYIRARCALAAGDEAGAAAILDQVVDKISPATSSLILKAEGLEEKGRLEEASGYFEKALEAVMARRAQKKEWSEPPDYILGRLKALKKKMAAKTGR